MLPHELDSREIVEEGLKGINQGLSNGMPRLNRYLDGIHKGTYYLIGAESNVGKSTLADYMFLYNLHKSAKQQGKRLQMDYYSLELPYKDKKTRIMSLLYYMRYKVSLPSAYIRGRKSPMLLTKEEQRLMEPIHEEVNELFNDVNFLYGSYTPTAMWKRLTDRAALSGEFIRDVDEEGRQQQIVGYKPFPGTENIMRFTFVDHLALLEPDQYQRSTKEIMDAASKFFVRARNNFDDSFCIVQQFNTEMQGAARVGKSEMAYIPSRQDFGDSKYTFRDADVVMGLTRPSNFQLESFGDFNRLGEWGQYFILNFIMKNRGPLGGPIPMFMNSIAGVPEELDPSGWSPLHDDLYIKRANELDSITRKYDANNTSKS